MRIIERINNNVKFKMIILIIHNISFFKGGKLYHD
nr:MAG TPA: hypothetical protein [Bacteriophage sp.]DAQ91430.1 MAG TPA: hypothetical protein [Caudoviricetes sp.]